MGRGSRAPLSDPDSLTEAACDVGTTASTDKAVVATVTTPNVRTRTLKELPARSSHAATSPVNTSYWTVACWYGAASVWRKPEEGS